MPRISFPRVLAGRFDRRSAAVVAVVAVAAIAAGPASAFGPAGNTFPAPDGANGWYVTVVSGQMLFDVAVAQQPHQTGDFDEAVFPPDARCVINTVTVSVGGGFADFGLPVNIGADSQSPAGTQVSCTAEYQRRVYSCLFPGVCFVGEYQPFFNNIATNTHTIKLDRSPPSINRSSPFPNGANGWFRFPTPMTVFGFDGNSGINGVHTSSTVCGTETLSGPDGIGKQIEWGCTNDAGLEKTDVFTYKFDGTAPTLAPTVSPNPITLNESATASPNANDNLSGIDTASCAPVDTSTLGTHTVTCTAKDLAGNPATAQASYEVVPAACNGLIATITGTAGDDVIEGTSGNDVIYDAAGNNKITSRGGNDTICTGGGNDTIDSGDAADYVDAGGGDNKIWLRGEGDTLIAGDGNDTIDSGDGADTVNAGGGDNEIFLRGESDALFAGDGNDTIDSGEGADTVHAGGGNNEIWLRGANDQVTAGAGNDTINGGAGTDTCNAGGGVNNVTLCEL